ncbi:hypothetical protein EQG63_10180 [Flavobacterium amnicola]|jgi:hypothetical protein|uniref:Uncharacterized protein n=1 Tax=Flavobacterium amnicola TaxID=2506422 RepID=A0A4Q1K118_9FLAO|nr:hypothetical protein [Flavobacterium amnicola]RXR17842.1 hypothetical protein EQG63_10180 [Flavobacterium amnicola]
MKKLLLISILFISVIGIAQPSLNDYNTAIIPAKFEFQKEDNQYRINSTIKAFLKQKGFEVYLSSDVLPEGFMDYNCNKVFVNAVEESTMFKTALKLEFKDCRNNVLFATDFGETREKEYGKAYNEVLLIALKSFDKAKYKYSGKTYFDEEAQEKLKSMDKVEVSMESVKTEKNEISVKVFNTATKEELVLYKTTRQDVFLCNRNGKNGVVLAKGGIWYFESIENEKVSSDKLDIKF